MIENNEKSSVVHPSPYPPIIGPHPPTTTVQKEHTADTTAAKFNEVQGSRDEGASSRNKGGSSRDVGVSSSDEEMRVRLEALEVDIAREQSAQSSSSSRKTVPVSVSSISGPLRNCNNIVQCPLALVSVMRKICLNLPTSNIISLYCGQLKMC